jgi:uncharacterized membrane protein
MMDWFNRAIEYVCILIESAGTIVIVSGMAIAGYRQLTRGRDETQPRDPYDEARQHIGRAILLGLEFLVAADIIRTISVEPNLENVSVLAIVVLIRTFLSVALEVELTGRWPWERKQAVTKAEAEEATRP